MKRNPIVCGEKFIDFGSTKEKFRVFSPKKKIFKWRNKL